MNHTHCSFAQQAVPFDHLRSQRGIMDVWMRLIAAVPVLCVIKIWLLLFISSEQLCKCMIGSCYQLANQQKTLIHYFLNKLLNEHTVFLESLKKMFFFLTYSPFL